MVPKVGCSPRWWRNVALRRAYVLSTLCLRWQALTREISGVWGLRYVYRSEVYGKYSRLKIPLYFKFFSCYTRFYIYSFPV